MIYYIAWSIGMVLLFVLGRKLFKKPEPESNFNHMINDNASVQTVSALVTKHSNEGEMMLLLSTIAEVEDDGLALRALTEAYEQLIDGKEELDVLILTLSELLYEKATATKDDGEAKQVYRASRIIKRLAHNLYRKYRAKNPSYSNPKFLQFID